MRQFLIFIADIKKCNSNENSRNNSDMDLVTGANADDQDSGFFTTEARVMLATKQETKIKSKHF